MRVTGEGPTKITKATIEAAWRRRVPGDRLILRDRDCRGLALILSSTAMTWTYSYRPRGTDPLTERRWPNRTMTLGNPKTHSPDDARSEANRGTGRSGRGPVGREEGPSGSGTAPTRRTPRAAHHRRMENRWRRPSGPLLGPGLLDGAKDHRSAAPQERRDLSQARPGARAPPLPSETGVEYTSGQYDHPPHIVVQARRPEPEGFGMPASADIAAIERGVGR